MGLSPGSNSLGSGVSPLRRVGGDTPTWCSGRLEREPAEKRGAVDIVPSPFLLGWVSVQSSKAAGEIATADPLRGTDAGVGTVHGNTQPGAR